MRWNLKALPEEAEDEADALQLAGPIELDLTVRVRT